MASISAYPTAMPGQNFPPGHGPPTGENKRAHLYVGNLSARVTEYMLQEIFAVAGPVIGVKIIPDRNFQHGGLNYGFVEYVDLRAAETAIQTLSGRKIFDTEIKVNWAYQNQTAKEDVSQHCHVFVGDLSPEVNDEILRKTFSAFPSLSDARVMWDMNSGKSRGYGFLAFRDRADADQAIATMNGEWLGSRAIRVNWANQKAGGGGEITQPGGPQYGGGGGGGPPQFQQGGMGGFGGGQQSNQSFATPGGASYEVILQQSAPHNTTVYVGNLPPSVTQADIIPLFQNFGFITDIRIQADRGFSFIKLDKHENAAMAIANLQGTSIHGRNIRCSWGKDSQAPQPPLVPASHQQAMNLQPQQPQQMPMMNGGPPTNGAMPGPPQPTPDAYAYANQYANGDPNLVQQYAQYYMSQIAQQQGGR